MPEESREIENREEVTPPVKESESDSSSGDSDPREKRSRRSKSKSSKAKTKTSKARKTKTKAVKKEKEAFDPTESFLVPKHVIVSEEEKEELVRRYGSLELFPKILVTDPVVRRIGAKEGDLVRIEREDGVYYRYVVAKREYAILE